MVNRPAPVLLFFALLTLVLHAGCGGSAQPDPPAPPAPAPLSASNLNLIFVASEELAYAAPGDIDRTTANLTDRGLQRSLLLASFLKKNVLGKENVSAIYTLQPMTHLQTTGHYPDMVPLETMQQFAAMNQITLSYENLPADYCLQLSRSRVLFLGAAARWRGHAARFLLRLPGSRLPRYGWR